MQASGNSFHKRWIARTPVQWQNPMRCGVNDRKATTVRSIRSGEAAARCRPPTRVPSDRGPVCRTQQTRPARGAFRQNGQGSHFTGECAFLPWTRS